MAFQLARRIRLGRGLAIYREHRTWFVDVMVNRARVRMSLGTDQVLYALQAVLQGDFDRRVSEFGPECDPKLDAGPITIANAQPQTDGACASPGPVTVHNAPKPISLGGGSVSVVDLRRAREVIGDILGSIQAVAAIAVKTGSGAALPLGKKTPVTRARDEYVSAKIGEGIHPGQQTNITRQINFFVEFSGVVTLDQITPDHLEQYKTFIRTERKVGDWSARQKISIVKSWLTWAAEVKEYLARNPGARIGLGKVPRRTDIVIYNRDEIRSLLAAAREQARSAEVLLLLALQGGLRRAEAFERLHWEDIDLVRRKLRVRDERDERTKTEGSRIVPIFDGLATALRQLGPKESGHVFGTRDLRNVSKDVGAIFRSAKVNHHRDGLQNLRHVFTTLCLEHGIPVARVRSWLGHEDGLNTLERHYLGRWRGPVFPIRWRDQRLSVNNFPQF